MKLILLSMLATSGLLYSAEREVGVPVFGSDKYTEYLPGELPLVISSPHGGKLKPEAVADRTSGVRMEDANTQDLARRIAAEVNPELAPRTSSGSPRR